ncbi:hypothetical protein MNBD_GAMMA23-1959 [hydrothermal vent metagenome]|uniref:DnaK-related protein n=1 Tax=hydrothermal vent metagenome TaxID=652676 RepID=A0A3B0ZGB2_9ZZZZ
MSLPVLNIPSQDVSQRPKPYLRPKILQQWVDELPTADTNASAHMLLEKLHVINASRYPVQERMALMVVLYPIVQQVVLALGQKYHTAEIPLGRKERFFSDTCRKLLFDMAAGYKIIVSELVIKKKHKLVENVLLHEATYFAMVFLSWNLVESYSVYDPVDEGVWHDLHQLYRYAEVNTFNEIPLDDPLPSMALPIAVTIDYAYKRTLLLAIAEPYHLMQGEAWEIFRLVSFWTKDCDLLPNVQLAVEGEYAVDMSADLAPRFITHDLYTQEISGRVIDIDKIKAKLELLIQNILRGNFEDDLLQDAGVLERKQRDALLRLSDTWQGNTERSEPRKPSADDVRITTGLNSCHHFISMRAKFTPEMDELKIHTNKKAPALTEEEGKSFFATRYQEALKKDKRHIHTNYSQEDWQQSNLSQMGIALRCFDGHHDISVKVGEIVSYRFDGKLKGRWQTGVVRWIKSDSRKVLDIGIMDIAKSAVPVAVKAMSGIGKGTDYFRSLLIPFQVSLKQTRSIILPANIYDINTVLVVNLGKRMFHIRLTRLLLFTTAINQYEFDILEAPKQHAQVH